MNIKATITENGNGLPNIGALCYDSSTDTVYEVIGWDGSKAAYIEQERQQLLKWLQPGSTVYTVLRHVSSSGMPRRISCFIVLDGAIQDISGWVSTVS